MPLIKIRLNLDGKAIDADLFLAETVFQQEFIARRVTCAVEGQQVSLVTAEDLILFKLIASRPRDLIDAQDAVPMHERQVTPPTAATIRRSVRSSKCEKLQVAL